MAASGAGDGRSSTAQVRRCSLGHTPPHKPLTCRTDQPCLDHPPRVGQSGQQLGPLVLVVAWFRESGGKVLSQPPHLPSRHGEKTRAAHAAARARYVTMLIPVSKKG